MKPPPFDYVRAGSVAEAVSALAEAGPDAKVLSGGQSLVALLNTRVIRPSVLVDLNGVRGLDEVRAADGGLGIGALVRQTAMESSPLVRERLPLAAEALPHVGHFVTRNRGTVGGSIAHADAAAELPLALLVLGGSVVARSSRGARTIRADDFFVTHFTTALAPDEIVVETLWPGSVRGWGYAFEELGQRRGDYALAMAACALRVEDGRVAEARVGLGSVVERPSLVETPIVGRPLDEDAAREAGEAAARAVEPYGNLHASPAYLQQLVRVLVRRALLRAWRNAREGA